MAIGTVTLSAQDLNKVIEVEHDIEPIEKMSTKPNVQPPITLPPLHSVNLTAVERALTTRTNPTIPFLEPASYADTLYVSPYRGYVTGGISPTPFSATLSAGYRIMDTDRVRLSAWVEFDSRNYKKQVPWSENERYWRQNTASAGIDFRWSVGAKSTFKTAIDYTWDRYNTIFAHPEIFLPNILQDNFESNGDGEGTLEPLPVKEFDRQFYQTINLLNVDVNWDSSIDALEYNISLGYNHAAARCQAPMTTLFIHAPEHYASPLRENSFKVGVNGRLPFGENTAIGLDLGADIIRSTGYSVLTQSGAEAAPLILDYYDSESRGLFTFIPRFVFSGKPFTASIGARVQLSANSGNVFNLTPDVTLGWTPFSVLALDARITGGVETNSLEHRYGITPFINPAIGYQFSRVPLDANLNITVGPYLGAYLKLNGGYATARRWLMPVGANPMERSSTALFMPSNIGGWRFGAEIGYNWREKVIASVGYTHVPGDNNPEKGYYRWRDRARHELKASVDVKPINKLTINASYQLRTGRRVMDTYNLIDAETSVASVVTRITPLSNVSLLNLGATYSLSDRLSLYLRGENILNRSNIDLAIHPTPGINIFVGASYLF